ncbi:MAG TPA: aldehyde dehydrogenase family protein [Acidimicrobiia bacterium]|nr:aldehyde dehydrogenase family protein [Acidimicrobiia bacterium]
MSFLDSAPRLDQPVSVTLPGFFAVAAGDDGNGDVPAVRLFIGGEWREASGGDTFDVRSPIDGTVIARAARAGQNDVIAAIDAARDARAEFRAQPAAERLELCEHAAGIMAEHLETFVDVIVANLGKTPSQAQSEANATRERLGLAREEVRKIFGEYLPGDWIADTKGKSGIVLREPVGTVGAIGPFNYPLFLAASKIIPALAAGNTVVAKAPSDDPLPLVLFACLLEEAGLPHGVLNVITGPGGEIGDLLAEHDDISMISFTGSTAVGRRIARLASPKPIHLELGGNAAAIVLADADLDLAVDKTLTGAFKNAGQRCDAISRVLVEDSVYDAFLKRAVDEAESWTVGDPRADGVKVGPLVNPRAAENVQRLVADAVALGADVLMGGEALGTYHQPTVLGGVSPEAQIVWEETFGPVLTLVRVPDLDAAIGLANRSRYGLDSAVFTSNLDQAWKAAHALECGMVHVNDAPAHGVGHFPFGGYKPDSGIGREGLGYSIDECTRIKTVVMPA